MDFKFWRFRIGFWGLRIGFCVFIVAFQVFNYGWESGFRLFFALRFGCFNQGLGFGYDSLLRLVLIYVLN